MSKNIKILLVGHRAADADDIKRELGILPGFSYTAWYCSDLPDALRSIGAGDLEPDLVFLDLALFTSANPKEFFPEIMKMMPDMPIIILSADRKDDDLVQYMIENGASGNVSQWELRNEADRLRELVLTCCENLPDEDRPAPILRTLRAANDVLKTPPEQAINIRLLPEEPDDPALN